MRADADTVFMRKRHGCGHHIGVTGMTTAGDICGCHDVQQCCVIAHGPWAKAFAHIGIQIDRFHGFCPFSKGFVDADTTPLINW